MDNFFNKKTAKQSAFLLNGAFFFIHIGFFILFWFFAVKFMAYFNIFSILFYAAGFLLIKREILQMYVVLMSFEVVAHMVAACICLGGGYGFQLCLLGLVPVFFYSEYFSLRGGTGKKIINGTLLSLFCLSGYVTAVVYMFFNEPFYVTNALVERIVCVVMGVFIFSVVIAAMKILTMFFYNKEDSLSKQAEYDALTGLPNRHYMAKVLDDLMNSEDVSSYWLAMIDIDDFKKINDTYGHNFGDKALVALANILMENEDKITICRWGGEEFLLIGKVNEKGHVPISILDGIRHQVEEYVLLNESGKRISLTVTIGVASYNQENYIEDWISIADKRLYVGKYNGKNRVVC